MNGFEPKFHIMPFMGRRPTITDVAKVCGVTPATVSRVLNAKQKFSTSEAVREKIHTTARKMGYVPDLAAQISTARARTSSAFLLHRERTSQKASMSRCWKASPRCCTAADTTCFSS